MNSFDGGGTTERDVSIRMTLSGAPNDGFLLNALKTLLRLSGVLSDV